MTAVYGDAKVPGAKLAATTDALIAMSVEYKLPIVTEEPTVAVQKIVKYSADLVNDPFDASTPEEVTITTTPGSNVMKAEFVSGPAQGFMKADFTVAE